MRKVLLAAAAFAMSVSLLAGCGGDADADGDAAATPAKAADDAHESGRRFALLAADRDWQGVCNLLIQVDQPNEFYPDQMDECLQEAESDDNWFAEVPSEQWLEVANTPDGRVDEGSNGDGDPKLEYYDDKGDIIGAFEFEVVDGLYYVFPQSEPFTEGHE